MVVATVVVMVLEERSFWDSGGGEGRSRVVM